MSPISRACSRCFLGLLLMGTMPAHSALLALDPADAGQIDVDVTRIPAPLPIFVSSFSHSIGLTEIGGYGSEGGGEYSTGYAIYDLSALTYPVSAATLVLDLSFAGNPGDLVIGGLELVSATELAALPAGPLGTIFGSDLTRDLAYGGGALSGTTPISGSGFYQLALNTDARATINSGSGLFALGINVFDRFATFPAISATFNAPPRLLLEGAAPHPVPQPGTALLMLLALAAVKTATARDVRRKTASRPGNPTDPPAAAG